MIKVSLPKFKELVNGQDLNLLGIVSVPKGESFNGKLANTIDTTKRFDPSILNGRKFYKTTVHGTYMVRDNKSYLYFKPNSDYLIFNECTNMQPYTILAVANHLDKDITVYAVSLHAINYEKVVVNMSADNKICAHCGCIIENDDCAIVDNEFWCSDCVDQNKDEIFECAECGELFFDTDRHDVENNCFCDSCFDCLVNDGQVAYCDHCEEYHYGTFYTVYFYNGMSETWCQSCCDIDASMCADCENYYPNDDGVNDENLGFICNRCVQDSYFYCDDCGCLVSSNTVIERDGCYYCLDCAPNRIILDYHEHYDIIFRGEEDRFKFLHMGVELEIDGGGEDDDNASNIMSYFPADHVVTMHDGSLDEGFEIVSNPATLDYHKKAMDWIGAMDEAKSLGYVSHDGGNCGLHVHVDRRYFSDSFERPTELLNMLVVNNKDWLIPFSRRIDDDYCKFPNRSPFGDHLRLQDYEALTNLANTSDRYVAINNNNQATIEFRFFRGTLQAGTFYASLQLVEMFCFIVKHWRIEQVNKVRLHTLINLAKRRGYTEFIKYVENRKLKPSSDEYSDKE